MAKQVKPMKNAENKIKESPLFWPAKLNNNTLLVLDETLIPKKVHYVKVTNTQEAVNVIRQMKTRAFGQFLVVLNTFLLNIDFALSDKDQVKILKKTAQALNNSRPTFPFSEVTSIVVAWAEKAIKHEFVLQSFVRRNILGYLEGIRARRLQRVKAIADLIQDGDSVLTHCNVSGELAMAASLCLEKKKDVHFFATETRPYLQGSKLTCWELKRIGAEVTLIADNAVGSVMADGLINKVIVGSDRSCANGDFANKIGTYQIAVLAREFDIPFYVLTQPSDKIKRGSSIPIEIRDGEEILRYEGRKIVRGNVKAFYPGFDVVPRSFITKAIPINTGQ